MARSPVQSRATASLIMNHVSCIMNQVFVTIETFVPETHAEKVRRAMGEAGAGKIENYSHCSFSVKGTGRFRPEKGAKPAIGKVGKFEKVKEERLTMQCERRLIKKVISAIKEVHPFFIYSVEKF